MRRWIGIGGILAATLAVGLLSRQRLLLEIVQTDARQVVLCAEMTDGEEFILSFVHSVNRRPVYDTLRIGSDHLVIAKSRFEAFGAGMPETSNTEGTLRVAKDGWLEWTVNRAVPDVTVRVGRVANHVLHLKGREIPLATLATPGTALTLRAHRRSVYTLWKGRCIR